MKIFLHSRSNEDYSLSAAACITFSYSIPFLDRMRNVRERFVLKITSSPEGVPLFPSTEETPGWIMKLFWNGLMVGPLLR
jgi:hypothetical protein